MNTRSTAAGSAGQQADTASRLAPIGRRTALGCRTTLVLGVTALLLSGCGARPVSGGAATDGAAIHVRYEAMSEGGESGGVLQSQDVIAQGERFRMSVSDATTPDEVYQTVVWDGEAMLLIEGGDASRQQDVPEEERPSSFFLRSGDATFDRICPGGTQQGSAQVAGRQGTVYSCPAHNAGEGSGESSEITLDDATGLLLRSVAGTSRLVAVEVDAGAAVDENTFSTDIPTALRGPEDAVDDSGTPLPLTATASVPRAGGGELLLADVRQGPSLVVIGELPGVTDMLETVLPRTDGGTAPHVYVLLNPITASEEEPADPDLSLATEEGTRKLLAKVSEQVRDVPVPVGIDIKGGAAGEELRSFEELMAGTTVLVAIDESGARAWRMTDDELTRSTDQLDTWVASTS